MQTIEKYRGSNWAQHGLFSALLAIFILLAGCTPSNVSTISAKEASAMFAENKAIIVDVREDSEWNEQHIEGAIHIPLSQVERRLGELAQYKNSTVITQCHSGSRSGKAASTLQKAGFSQVYSMDGGIVAWVKDGLSTVKQGGR